MNNTRYKYIDIAKGIGIFLVVFGHVTHNIALREYIWSFHMPLFFFISGYLFNPTEGLKIHIKKRIKSIIIPYIIFYVVTYCYWAFFERHFRGGEYSLLHQLIGLPYGTYSEYMYFNGALWFLPCLFTTDLLFSIVKKYTNNREWLIVISYLILFFCVGTYLLKENCIYLPFGFNTAFFALVFYGTGYICKVKITMPKIQNPMLFVKLCILCFLLMLVQYQSTGIDGGDVGKADLTYVILAAIGITLCMSLSVMIRSNGIIEYLGKNSLIIFAFQEQTYRALLFASSSVLHIPVENIRTNLGEAFLVAVMTIICIIPLIYIWNKWFSPVINKL